MAQRYSPGLLPNELPGRRELAHELRKIADTFAQMQEGDVLERRATPIERPPDGMLALADGYNWDPGEGRGLYYYDEEDGWHKIG